MKYEGILKDYVDKLLTYKYIQEDEDKYLLQI